MKKKNAEFKIEKGLIDKCDKCHHVALLTPW